MPIPHKQLLESAYERLPNKTDVCPTIDISQTRIAEAGQPHSTTKAPATHATIPKRNAGLNRVLATNTDKILAAMDRCAPDTATM